MYLRCLVFLGLVNLMVVHCQALVQPNECSNYTELNTRDRSMKVHRGNVVKCDWNDISKGWYRFSGQAGNAIATSAPAIYHCGTNVPGWMEGSHPTAAQGIVTRRVCYHWSGSICYWSNYIRVRNCGVFYVYELDKTPSCSFRYCGNGGNFGNFTFKMHICKAYDCQQTYIPSEYPVSVDLNQPLFIVYKVENTVKNLVVFAEKCLATNTNDPTSEPQHTFLDRGCPQDTTMTYNYNPARSVQYFSINSFRFLHTSSKLVYLHCQLLVCFRDSPDSRCAKGCLGKRKRRRRANDVYKDTSNAYDLSTGPVKSQNGIKNDFDQNKGSSDDNKTMRDMTIGLAVMGAVLAAVFAVVLVKFGCKSRTSAPKNMATSDGPAFANKGFDDPDDLNFKKVDESIG